MIRLVGIKNLAADDHYRLQTTDADTDSIEEDLTVAVIETDNSNFNKVPLENDQQALDQVIEDNDSVEEGQQLPS